MSGILQLRRAKTEQQALQEQQDLLVQLELREPMVQRGLRVQEPQPVVSTEISISVLRTTTSTRRFRGPGLSLRTSRVQPVLPDLLVLQVQQDLLVLMALH